MFPENTALILIDVQQGFDEAEYWGPRNNSDAEANMAKLLNAWRQANQPVFHVQHLSNEPQSPLRPNQPGCEFKPEVQPLPDEPVFQKNVNSGFIGTNLESTLREKGIATAAIVGLTTNHCVSTTTRMAGNLGFNVFVVEDATATFDLTGHDGNTYPAQQVHTMTLASLHQEFATVVQTQFILDQLGVTPI